MSKNPTIPVGVQGVVGSNPAAPTNFTPKISYTSKQREILKFLHFKNVRQKGAIFWNLYKRQGVARYQKRFTSDVESETPKFPEQH